MQAVHIVQDDGGVVATEFERHALEVRGSRTSDFLPRGGSVRFCV